MLVALAPTTQQTSAKTASSRPLPEINDDLGDIHTSAEDALTGVNDDTLDPAQDRHIRELLAIYTELFQEPERNPTIVQRTGIKHEIVLLPGTKSRSFASNRMSHF